MEPLQNVQSPKNAPLEFGCLITADPMPDTVWYKYGEPIQESLDVQFKHIIKELEHGLKEIKYYLFFPAGRHCDTGSYTLKGSNKFGSFDTTAHLDILLKPEIEGFKDQITVPYQSVTYEVSIYANPKPKVTWSRNNINCGNIDNCNVIADVEKEVYT